MKNPIDKRREPERTTIQIGITTAARVITGWGAVLVGIIAHVTEIGTAVPDIADLVPFEIVPHDRTLLVQRQGGA